MINTTEAIASLRPNIEWSMSGDDVENIIWHTEGAEPLTTDEVEAEILRLEAESVAKEAESKQARLDAIESAVKL